MGNITKSNDIKALKFYDEPMNDIEFFNKKIQYLTRCCKEISINEEMAVGEYVSIEALRLSAKDYYLRCINKGKDRNAAIICAGAKMLYQLVEELKVYDFFCESLEDSIEEIDVLFCNSINEIEV